MRLVTLVLNDRRQPWTLGIEPWAEAIEVPAKMAVRLEIQFQNPADAERPDIDVSYDADGLSVGIDSPIFTIEVGKDKREFDFSYMIPTE